MLNERTKQERQAALRERIKNNAKKKGKKSGGEKRILDTTNLNVKFFRPQSEKSYLIDIIPWTIKTKYHPQGMKPGEEDYVLDIWVHRWIGVSNATVLCLEQTYGHKCPICEERRTLMQDDSVEDSRINALKPQHRGIYNIIDLNNEAEGIQIFDESHSLFEAELLDEASKGAGEEDDTKLEVICFADLQEGKSIRFRTVEKTFYVAGNPKPKSFTGYKSFRFIDREPLNDSMLEQSYSLDKLLIIPTYEEVNRIFHGVDFEDAKEETAKETDSEKIPWEKLEKEAEKREVKETEKEEVKEAEKKEVKSEDQPIKKEEGSTIINLNNMNKRELRRYIKENNLDIQVTLSMSEDEIRKVINNCLVKQGKKEGTEEKSKCPYGHKFGVDIDSKPDCMDCEIYEDCADENDQQKK